MGPIAIIAGICSSLQLLKSARNLLSSNNAANDAMLIASRRMADDVGSLQDQLKAHRGVIDKLVAQMMADEEMLQKHNEILIQLGEAAQEALSEASKLRRWVQWAIGLSVAAIAAAIVAIAFK